MSLTYREFKKEKLDHFYCIGPLPTIIGQPAIFKVDVAGYKHMYINDIEIKQEDLQTFLSREHQKCFRTELEAESG